MYRETRDDVIDLAESVHDSLALLQSLYVEQEKRKHLHSNGFVITDYLHTFETEDYQLILASEKTLCTYAAKLFDSDIALINFKKKRKVSEHCAEIIFEIEGKLKIFYIKQAWEGAIKEGLGLEFNNLLTDTPIRYLCSSKIVITEKVFDPLTPEQVYVLRDTPSYLFAFGAWEIFTTWLYLTDRKTSNIRWNGQHLANIDFGLVFYRGKLVFDSRFTITENSEIRRQGQVYALSWVLNKLQQPKVQQLLLNMDSKFCRNLVCHRHPVPPLRTMIKILQEDTCQELYT
ncbi:MAG: hypothetical protein GQ569_08710 [Methylococcaceae bacterium]|nr:hypothetical protein [Methylococcaceae bacterium]